MYNISFVLLFFRFTFLTSLCLPGNTQSELQNTLIIFLYFLALAQISLFSN
nr:MAG TPA: hypothetical protein [Caudoviricetes sp.]